MGNYAAGKNGLNIDFSGLVKSKVIISILTVSFVINQTILPAYGVPISEETYVPQTQATIAPEDQQADDLLETLEYSESQDFLADTLVLEPVVAETDEDSASLEIVSPDESSSGDSALEKSGINILSIDQVITSIQQSVPGKLAAYVVNSLSESDLRNLAKLSVEVAVASLSGLSVIITNSVKTSIFFFI